MRISKCYLKYMANQTQTNNSKIKKKINHKNAFHKYQKFGEKLHLKKKKRL